MIPSIQYCLISTGILPALPLIVQSHFSWWMTPKQQAGGKEGGLGEGFGFPCSIKDNTKGNKGDSTHFSTFVVAKKLSVPLECCPFFVFDTHMHTSISTDHIWKQCVSEVENLTTRWKTSLNFLQQSHLWTMGPFITQNTSSPNPSSSSFDLSVWLRGVLCPWIMVKCCTQSSIIMHANELPGRGDEDTGENNTIAHTGLDWKQQQSHCSLNIMMHICSG